MTRHALGAVSLKKQFFFDRHHFAVQHFSIKPQFFCCFLPLHMLLYTKYTLKGGQNLLDIYSFRTQYPLLWKKIDILCHGINSDERGLLHHFYQCQNPLDTHRTGNAGLQVKLGEQRIPLNVAVYKKFCMESPYFLAYSQQGNLGVLDVRDNSFIDVYCPGVAPSWYEYEIESHHQKAQIGSFILLEGDFTAITSITTGCLYFNMGKPCAFCAIGADTISDNDIRLRENMILSGLSVVVEDSSITNFHLTGGNTLDSDRGASSYIKYVDVLRKKRRDARIAVEIPPPEESVQKDVFYKLKSAGTDSITINMEFWDDDIRQKLMPIKGNIPKTDYLSAFHTALEIFGSNKVTCGFIVGIENISSTYKGIDYLTDLGVVTEVYPFKPNSGSLMENHSITATDDIVRVSLYANSAMQVHGIAPNECSGCVKCGACGLTQELIAII